MIKDLHCSIALMCIAPKTSAFSFRRQVPQFMFACHCSGSDSEYRSATITASSRPADTEAVPSRPANHSDMFGNFLSDTREPDQTVLWHTITGEATLASPENGVLYLRLVDVKNAHEINVAIQIPLGTNGCNVRKEMSKWSDVKISLAGNNDQYKFISKPIVKVTGKACYGKDYSFNGDTSSRLFSGGSDQANLAMWELYPVMKQDLVHDAHVY
jgi:hypothetical protein